MKTTMSLCLTAALSLTVASAATKPVVVVKGTHTVEQKAQEAESINTFFETVTGALDRAGIEYETMGDGDVEQGKLAGAEVAIFAYNPNMSDREVKAAVDFVTAGGKVVIFYTMPSELARALGFRPTGYLGGERVKGQFEICRTVAGLVAGMPERFWQYSWNINGAEPARPDAKVLCEWLDSAGRPTGRAAVLVSKSGVFMTHVLTQPDPEAKARLMLALVGHFIPGVWAGAAQRARDAAASVGQAAGIEDLERMADLAPADKRASVQAQVQETMDLLARARRFAERGLYPEAVDAAIEARNIALRAYCTAQPTRRSELRGVWIHTAFGVNGWGWEKSIRHLKEMGFNAIFPNMLWGGVAYYDSDVLPVAPEVAQRGDQIAECVNWCKRYGVQCHVWKVNFNLGRVPDEFLEKLRAEGRLQRNPNGEEIKWLCPSDPRNIELEKAAMLEVACKYDVDGIHFDYIRYPGIHGCYCDRCRRKFEESIGRKATGWPDCVLSGPLRDEYLQFRRDNITRLVQEVYRQVKRIKPSVQVSAAVFGDFPSARESVGQDTALWIDRGVLDFVCPMDYTPNDQNLERLVKAQVAAVGGRIPLYIGIGAWRLHDAAQLSDQIAITRRLGADGFVCFHYNDPQMTDTWMPLLREGVLYADAVTPHLAPLLQAQLPRAAETMPRNSYEQGTVISATVRLEKRYGIAESVLQVRHIDGRVALELCNLPPGRLQTVELSLEPGDYRLAVEGKVLRAEGETYFLRQGRIFHVLSRQETAALMSRNLPPVFTGSGVKVGIYTGGYGSQPILDALKAAAGVNARPLYRLTAEMLAPCEVVVLPQPKPGNILSPSAVHVLRDWVRRGHGLLVTHDAVGWRNNAPILPEVARGKALVNGKSWRVATDIPGSALDPKKLYEHTFYDRVILSPGPDAIVWATTQDGQPLVAAGRYGEGRFVAVGMAVGVGPGDADVAPSSAEAALLRAAVNWLKAT